MVLYKDWSLMMSVNLKNDIKPISYIKSHAADMLKYVNECKNPVVITQNGEAKAVLVDVDSYQRVQDAFALLNLVRLGEKDYLAGRTRAAKEVFAELRADIKEHAQKI
ncbi:MAG: type II toxin-antitoxin system Phd/YefM family antitoxin [Candidatus Margulisbacteria bacterium]|jgi:prevent-host-death family protein|nr:type II toxin-antitoxin system Phd/YefM family antitoxin [Candidatus Margulisiibacteriota bacterium]